MEAQQPRRQRARIPQAVYDNGQKTFILFAPSILHGESPALLVMERGERQLVNYSVKQNLYVVEADRERLRQVSDNLISNGICGPGPPARR
jgi:type IV secretory pathway VirB9-like protein